MAKKKMAKKATAQQTVTVFVPDAIYNLGDGMNSLIGKINFLWATSFGVQEVDVYPASQLCPSHSMNPQTRPKRAVGN